FNFQTEFNYVRPYTYAHGSVQQSYGHMNQALAHPLGANFWESVSFMNYRYKRLFIEGKLQYAVYGGDSAGTDYGKNIFISYKNRPSDYGNFTTQGFQTNLITVSLRAAYILDTRMNLKIELGGAYRVEERAHSTKQTPYFFIGLRSDLSNIYTDI
ncbi:MAG: gliding motility protein RemB, partial [Bacteroidia bacterium]|nr:gliding motility protein RemB [Bacteroidia bacterium]